jgi:hypothetical protein
MNLMNQRCCICERKGAVILDFVSGEWFCSCCFDEVNEIYEEHYVNGSMANRTCSNWIRAVLDIKECFKHSVAVH